MLQLRPCVEPPHLQPPVKVKKSKKIKKTSDTVPVPIPSPVSDLKFVKKHVSNKENVSVPCKKTKKKEDPDSKNLVQNPDPGGGGGGGKADDPILTFEQKNRLDIERYEAYCAKSSFLHKKFVPKNLAQK